MYSQEMSTVSIMLVDDDEVDVEAFRRALVKERVSNPLVVAHDGLQALDKLRGQNGETIERPFVIVLDLNMPRMNGIEFLKEIRADEKLSNAVVFVMTTSSSENDILDAYKLNIAGYIVKSNMGKGFVEAVRLLDHYWQVIQLPNSG